MAKKKTKAQKIKAKSFSVPETRPTSKPAESHTDTLSLYPYDPAYLAADLVKTILVSAFILAIQIGLYLWLR